MLCVASCPCGSAALDAPADGNAHVLANQLLGRRAVS